MISQFRIWKFKIKKTLVGGAGSDVGGGGLRNTILCYEPPVAPMKKLKIKT